ncbi:putative protein serine/threonine kinase [Heterostelium album PN500]|uniref:Uncharacterized protein n=1 Tax=Heterostelium pallidum (strain ATCC 26659 / Pp 5 / PN500) TaxID=670386 RepID=D3AZV9_HETP5|nr:putative protein serine/threonine kinase [Heterostelium album PN500]EFA84583.1 putative protein serine/threonine kinase [Heterostelium album PN500]|eukprot:XP_020436696.1 putative protein serine/threonine kinase [Heterostelium album PN500]
MSVSDWENVKENILPLKGGRDPSKLAMCTQQQKSANEDKIQQEKAQFEKELSEYKGEDPLDIWSRYVRWVQQSFIGGNMKKELIVLLERCTSMFVNNEKYRNDQRYMKLWIIYADMCRDPIEIFNYLETNKIGLTLSLFYEAKAIIYENKSNYQMADQSYQLGLKRQAQPLDRLKKRHDDFQRRMVVAMSKSAKEGGIIPSLSVGAADSVAPRAALGTLSTREAVGSERRSATATGAPLGASSLMSSMSKSGTLTGEKRKAPSSNSGMGGSFQIYNDESGVGEKVETNSKFLGKSGKSATESVRWEELEPELTKHKENSQAPSRWNDTKIVQKRQKSDSGPSFEIYCDADIDQNQQHTAASPDKLANYSRSNTVEQIQNNPLANHLKNSTLLSASVASSSVSSASAASSATASSSKKERVGYKKELFMVGNEELSFEEIRAKNWKPKKPTPVVSASASSMPAAPQPKQMAPPSPTMTIHTKEALKHVMSWFHSPIAFETKASSSVAHPPNNSNNNNNNQLDDDQKHLDNQENIDPATLPNQPQRPKITNGDIVKKTLFSNDEQTEDFIIYDRGDLVHTHDRIDQYIKQEIQAFEILEDPSLSNNVNTDQQAPPNTLTEKIKSSAFQASSGMGFKIFQDENVASAPKPNPLFGGAGNKAGGFTIFQDEPTAAAPKSNPLFGGQQQASSGLGFKIFQDENQSSSKPAAKSNPLFGNNAGGGFSVFQDPEPVVQTKQPAPKSNPLFGNNAGGGGFTIFQDPAEPVQPKPAPKIASPVSEPTIGYGDKTELIELKLVPESGVAEPYNEENKAMLEMCVSQHMATIESFTDYSSDPMPKVNNGLLPLDKSNPLTVKEHLTADRKILSVETDSMIMVAKINQPASVWEFYSQGQLVARLAQNEANEKLINKFLSFYSVYQFSDASVSLIEYAPAGTLEQLVNKVKSNGKSLEEPLKMFLAIDLLRSVSAIHNEYFIHANISPQNIYLSFTDQIETEWTSAAVGSWIQNGLKIGGFSRTIDLEMYGLDTTYNAPLAMFASHGFPVSVLKSRSSWRHDIDYLGIAGTLYFMVSDGKKLDDSKVEWNAATAKWKLCSVATDLKATLRINIWTEIIEQLLNATKQISLATLQQQLESYLEANPAKSKEIKRSLRKLKIECDS